MRNGPGPCAIIIIRTNAPRCAAIRPSGMGGVKQRMAFRRRASVLPRAGVRGDCVSRD